MVTALTTRPDLRRPSLLLDENGRTIPITRRTVVQGNPRGIETYNSHPATGLTVEMLLANYRQAEYGSPIRQFDMFHDIIERDGHLRSLINDRIESVAGCDWVVMAGRGDKPSELAAGALNERLSNQLQFRTFMQHQLTSVHYGFAATNMVWDFDEGVIVPTKFVNPAHRRFCSPGRDRADEIWLIDGNRSISDIIELQPGLWATSRYPNILGRNPWAAGLMRTCAIWSMFKGLGWRDWMVFADMFGLPLAIGYYEEGAGPESRLALEDAVRAIGQDGYAVLSALTELVIKETARGGDSSTVYPQIIKVCEEQVSKLLTGGTLNTDVAGVGSYNAASVHESRSYAMKCWDAQCVQEGFVRDIGQTFVAWNGYDRAAPPRLKIKIKRDALQWAQTVEIIGQAIPIDSDQLYEDFSLRVPGPGRGVKFEPTKPPDPGHAREDKKK